METIDDVLTTGTNRALSGISGRMLEKIALWRLKAASSVRAMKQVAAKHCRCKRRRLGLLALGTWKSRRNIPEIAMGHRAALSHLLFVPL
jgi:hypothetical protein